jgi:TolA-binding protein
LLALAIFALHSASSTKATAQVTPEQAAEMILNSARKSFNEKNYPVAGARFREFLTKFANHKDASSAKYSLALCLLESPERNFAEAQTLLKGLADLKDYPDLPSVQYHLGLALRNLGMLDLEVAQAKPNEAVQRRNQAQQRFQEALTPLGEAVKGFEAKAKSAPADAKELPIDLEWAARARCEQAEMFLRLQKPKEAQAVTVGFVKDPVLSKTKVNNQGRYFYAFASFLLKEYDLAQQTLTTLAPFSDLHWGNHARYLLARTHHLADERAEAALHYEGVLADYAINKKNALDLLNKGKLDAVEKTAMDALARGPAPEHVVRATFYLGVLKYEAGNFGEALSRFADFPKLYPQSPLRNDAELRMGFCQVQMRAYPDAIKTLTPMIERDPALSDQVLFWLGKAQAGTADPSNQANYQKTMTMAIATLQQALARSQKLNQQDPTSLQRRAEILLEIADSQQHLKQYKEAAGTYGSLLRDKLLPVREEEVTQRLVTALHLAGDFDESDKQCKIFQEKFPKSTLLPAVMFSVAENSFFRTQAKEKTPSTPESAKELARLYGETAKILAGFIEKYPDYPKINVARYTLGLAYYRQGELDKAKDTLAKIPAADRDGELAVASYVIADCNFRQTPLRTEGLDALEAGKVEEKLKIIVEQLDTFVAGPIRAETGEALLKLGLAHQLLAGLQGQNPDKAQQAEKAKSVLAARNAYSRLLGKEFIGNNKLVPQANLELAKCMALSNDINGAIRTLQAFTNDPLKNSDPAPMAFIHLATLLRGQNKQAEAAALLARGRELFEANLAKDPERADQLALLRYHQGVCLRESGKLPEARAVFELVVKQAPTRLEGIESALRLGQCLKEEGEKNLETFRKLNGGAGKKPEGEAAKQQSEGYKNLRAAAEFLETNAEKTKEAPIGADLRASMLYEAAWAMRLLAEPEVDAARAALAQEMLKKFAPSSMMFPPLEVPLDKVPLQPAEKKARELYQNLIKNYADSPLATDARFELGELFAQRKEFDQALPLFNDVLDKEPPPDMTDKVRLRIGEIQLDKGKLKEASVNFEAVAQNPKSAMFGRAQYLAAEVNLANNQLPEAIKRLSPFMNQQNLQNQPGLTDRALLRLGHAQAQAKNWEESRRAHNQVLASFPNSPWADEARYGLGFALQKMNQLDQAINNYTQVTARTAAVVAAKAQLQIGLCKLEQKKYAEAVNALMVVPTTYGYPELSAAALLETGRAHAEANQPKDAIRLYERVEREYPGSVWAKTAEEKLKKLGEKK